MTVYAKTLTKIFVLLLTISLGIVTDPTLVQGQNSSNDSSSSIIDIPIFFDLNIIVFDGDQTRIAYITEIAQEFRKIGINASVKVVESDEYYSRGILHELWPNCPTHSEGGFDMISGAFVGDDYTWLNVIAGFGQPFDPEPFDRRDWACYSNDELIILLQDYYAEGNKDTQLELFNKIQTIMGDELPVLTILQQERVVLHNSSLTLTDDFLTAFATGDLTQDWTKLDFNGKRSLNIAQQFPYLLPIWNFEPQRNIATNLIFQGLYERDINDLYNLLPVLAQKEPDWNDDYTTATVQLKENLTFSDGAPLSSLDVVETYRHAISPGNFWTGWGGPSLQPYFSNPNSVTAIDNRTIQFDFLNTAGAMDILDLRIMPEHIFGTHDSNIMDQGACNCPDDPFYSEFFKMELAKDGNSPLLTGTSSFRFDSFTSTGELNTDDYSEKITFVTENESIVDEDYINTITFHDLDEFSGTFFAGLFNEPEEGVAGLNLLLDGIEANKYDFTFPIRSVYNFSDIVKNRDIGFSRVDDIRFQTLTFNNRHPIFGADGEDSPHRTPESAKNIRFAMSHAIPRQKIIDDYLYGIGKPGTLPQQNTVEGFNRSYSVHSYDLAIAKQFMIDAGYVYVPEESNFASEAWQALTSNPIIPIAIVSVASATGLIVNKYSEFRLKSIFRKKSIEKIEAEQYLDSALKLRDKDES